MEAWLLAYLPEAIEDMERLDGSQRSLVIKAIDKVRENPLPCNEGGYGKPLGKRDGANLTGLLKVKLKRQGIRIVYKVERAAQTMRVVVVGVRSDGQVYKEAAKRRRQNDL